ITMGFLLAGLFFLRFWRRTGDTLFAIFAAAFWLFAVNQTVVAVLKISDEAKSFVYVLRLAAFLLIIVAIIAKNVREASREVATTPLKTGMEARRVNR
ncbi:MAG: DUF5985 family protein, partial [Candidatus Binataceae bacterium]